MWGFKIDYFNLYFSFIGVSSGAPIHPFFHKLICSLWGTETVLADSNNDHEMTILDGASNLDLSSISAAIPMQASSSQVQIQPQVPYINNMHSFQEIQFATHSGTSFISHNAVAQWQKRTCKLCKDAGLSGLNCGNWLQCKFWVGKYYFGKICAYQFIFIRMHKIKSKKYC